MDAWQGKGNPFPLPRAEVSERLHPLSSRISAMIFKTHYNYTHKTATLTGGSWSSERDSNPHNILPTYSVYRSDVALPLCYPMVWEWAASLICSKRIINFTDNPHPPMRYRWGGCYPGNMVENNRLYLQPIYSIMFTYLALSLAGRTYCSLHSTEVLSLSIGFIFAGRKTIPCSFRTLYSSS